MEEAKSSSSPSSSSEEEGERDNSPLLSNNGMNLPTSSSSSTTTNQPQTNTSSHSPPPPPHHHHPKLHPLQWWYLLLTETITNLSHAASLKYKQYMSPLLLQQRCQYYLPFFFSSSSSSSYSSNQQRRKAPPSMTHPKHIFILLLSLLLLLHYVQHSLTMRASQKFRVALEQSFGYFDDITEEQWSAKQKRVKEATRHAFPDDILRFIDEPNAWYHNNWDPDFTCQHERKMGGMGDGPKWVCDPHRIVPSVLYRQQQQQQQQLQPFGTTVVQKEEVKENGCLIYSIGINSDGLSFEHELLNLIHNDRINNNNNNNNNNNDESKINIGCEIHIFDPQVDKFHDEIMYSALLPEGSSITFHPWGIKGSDDVKDPFHFKSFQDTVKMLGHDTGDVVIDILKVDCKLCEWSIYKDWFDGRRDDNGVDLQQQQITKQRKMPRITQILVEVHGSPEHVVNDFFETMVKEGYVIFHKEANTEFYGGTCQEYAFLKLSSDFFRFEDEEGGGMVVGGK